MRYKYAKLSDCGIYRFALFRAAENPKPGLVLFVLNNPSTADGEVDDPTVRRGWGFTLQLGYQQMAFVNVNPWRSTDPKSARMPPEEILTRNDSFIFDYACFSSIRIAAWGVAANPVLSARAESILHLVGPLHALDFSKDGTPKHPLYLSGDLRPQLWA